MACKIAIANHKGGVGKTTSTATLADALARQGQRVLIMDMDPQANLTTLLIGDHVEPAITMANLLIEKESMALEIFGQGIVRETTITGVSLMPSGLELDYVANELRLNAFTSPVLYLKRRVSHIEDQFDFILIDTPPTMNLLTMNALGAADKLIVPFLAGDKMGLSGVVNLLRSIEQIKDPSNNPDLEILGAVITGYDGREHAHRTTDLVIEKTFNILGRVPRSAKVQRGALARKTILSEDRTSRAAREYVKIAADILEGLGIKPKRSAKDIEEMNDE